VPRPLSTKTLPYLLLAPSLIVLLSLILYPMGFALVNSLYFWNLQTSPTPMFFNGLQNYKMVFTTTPFLVALKNTVALSVIGTFVQFWLGMGIALLLYSVICCRRRAGCSPGCLEAPACLSLRRACWAMPTPRC
jgi:multiple sugar transport system permease protein